MRQYRMVQSLFAVMTWHVMVHVTCLRECLLPLHIYMSPRPCVDIALLYLEYVCSNLCIHAWNLREVKGYEAMSCGTSWWNWTLSEDVFSFTVLWYEHFMAECFSRRWTCHTKQLFCKCMFSFQQSENFYVAWCSIWLGRRGWEPFAFQMFALLTRPKVGPFSFPDLGPNVVEWKHKCWKTWKGDDPTCKDVCNGYGKGFEQKNQTISPETEWAEPQFAVWGKKKSEWFFTF